MNLSLLQESSPPMPQQVAQGIRKVYLGNPHFPANLVGTALAPPTHLGSIGQHRG